MEQPERDYLSTALELLLKDHEDTRKLVQEILTGLNHSRDKLICTLLDRHRDQMNVAGNLGPHKGTE